MVSDSVEGHGYIQSEQPTTDTNHTQRDQSSSSAFCWSFTELTLISALSSASCISAIWLARSVSLFSSSAFFWRAVRISTAKGEGTAAHQDRDLNVLNGRSPCRATTELVIKGTHFLVSSSNNPLRKPSPLSHCCPLTLLFFILYPGLWTHFLNSEASMHCLEPVLKKKRR